MRSTVESRVLDIIARQIGRRRSSVHAGMTLQDIGVDAYEAIDLFLAIEDAFGIALADHDGPPGVDPIGSIVEAVNAALAASRDAAHAA